MSAVMWYYLVLVGLNLGCLIFNLVNHNPWWVTYAVNVFGIVYCTVGFVAGWRKRRGIQ